MNILQLIELLRALDYVQGSSLTDEQKQAIAEELKASMPPRELCTTAKRTHDIVTGRLTPERPKEAPEDSKAGQRLPSRSEGTDVQPGAPRKAHGGFKKVARG
jgi:hypothetical protein